MASARAMTVLPTMSPSKSTPQKSGVKRAFAALESPRHGNEKRQRQVATPVRSIPLQRAKAPVGEPWPVHDLRVFDAPTEPESMINFGPMLKEILIARGWKYSAKPCHGILRKGEDITFFVKEFVASLRGEKPEKLFGKAGSVQEGYKLQYVPLPKHALWFFGRLPFRVPGVDMGRTREREDMINAVVEHGDQLQGKPGNYRMCKFPYTETLLFKTHLTEAFHDKAWYPATYILPKDKSSFLKEIASRGNSKNNIWIGKPRNDYGGAGIRVYKGTDPELIKAARSSDGAPRSLIQHYIADPHLIAGYKYHMRIHLVVTNLNPVQAYVQENGQCLFATKPYTLASKTMGVSFDPPVHVTNMGLNSKPENKENYFRKKPLIGRGQQIRMNQLVSHLSDTCPDFDKRALWEQILSIGKDTASYIAHGILKQFPKVSPDRHFEIFGMDLMLDKDMKVWMCEVNTNPGLGYPDKEVLGCPNPDYEKERRACEDTFHDLFALIGLDAGVQQSQGSLRHWFELDFSDEKTQNRSRSADSGA